jgi:hypothetical protein
MQIDQSFTTRSRPRVALLLVAAAAAIVITVAAGRNDATPGITTAQPMAHVSPLPTAKRILPTTALPGFMSTRRPAVVHSAMTWATSVERSTAPASEARRLRQFGFIAGIDERLHGRFPLAAEAVSLAERFDSLAGARAELRHQRTGVLASGSSAQRITRLRDVAIPGAFGWVDRSATVTGVSVMFTGGSYYYVVGSGFAPGAHRAPTPHDIVAAAQFLNLLVNGCVTSAAAAGRLPNTAAATPRVRSHASPGHTRRSCSLADRLALLAAQPINDCGGAPGPPGAPVRAAKHQ